MPHFSFGKLSYAILKDIDKNQNIFCDIFLDFYQANYLYTYPIWAINFGQLFIHDIVINYGHLTLLLYMVT